MTTSDLTHLDLLSHPRDHLIQDLAQGGAGFESEEFCRLAYVGRALLHVVFERWIRYIPERLAVAMHLAPDELGQLKNRGTRRRGQIEVLVESCEMLDADSDTLGQVAAIGVVPHLVAGAKNMQRVLSLEHLLGEIGD